MAPILYIGAHTSVHVCTFVLFLYLTRVFQSICVQDALLSILTLSLYNKSNISGLPSGFIFLHEARTNYMAV